MAGRRTVFVTVRLFNGMDFLVLSNLGFADKSLRFADKMQFFADKSIRSADKTQFFADK